MRKPVKMLRYIAVYLLILLLAGYVVYADPADDSSEETASSEDAELVGTGVTREKDSEDSSEGSSEDTESSSEEDPEATVDPEDPEATTELTSEQQITILVSYYSMEEILKMKEAYEQRQNEVTAAEAKLQKMEAKQGDYISTLKELDNMIIELQDKINQMEEDRRETELAIARLNDDLEAAQKEEQEQYERLKEHIRNAYENGNYSVVDAILNAESFADLINKPEYVQAVSQYDSELLDEYKKTSTGIANRKLMLQVLIDGTGVLQKSYEEQQEAMVLMTEAKMDEILRYQSSIDAQKVEVGRQRTLEEEIEARLQEMEMAQLVTISYTPTTFAGGIFVWPQPSSFYITSDYGWRGDIGIPGASKDHKGIDISANMYDPVVAAAQGTVCYVGYYGTGGKTVMIDIGSSITIIYHHLNDYAVELGEFVQAGQVVGYVGMTGVTGGPHLHFSVRVNGVYVNPRPYLGLPVNNQVVIIPTEINTGENTTEETSTEESSTEVTSTEETTTEETANTTEEEPPQGD